MRDDGGMLSRLFSVFRRKQKVDREGARDIGDGTGGLSSAFRRKQKVDLVVGLDFGTSSTKAAYRELGAATRRVIPIVFGHGLDTYPPYCLPSVGCLTPDRRLIWGPEAVQNLHRASWSEGIKRLKVLVAGEQNPAFCDVRTAAAYQQYLATAGVDPCKYRPEFLAAVAIAKQMLRIRDILQQQYGGAHLDIRFNICIPIDHMEHGGMWAAQQKINHVAEQIYQSWTADGWEDTELVEVASAKFGVATAEPRPDGRLFAMPEAKAQIASYLSSLEVKQGIHAVIDIGAGTTDLSIFNLVGPPLHEPECYWYAARNVPRGAGYIEAAVADRLAARLAPPSVVTEAELLRALEGARSKPDVAATIRDELLQIRDALRPTWTEGYARHYKRQSGWENIPVFTCGGGAGLVGVKEVFKKAWVPNFRDFTVTKLPVPDDYDSLGRTVPFDRLSVAYGLTYFGPELGYFSLPADSPDHTPPLRFKDFLPPPGDGEPG